MLEISVGLPMQHNPRMIQAAWASLTAGAVLLVLLKSGMEIVSVRLMQVVQSFLVHRCSLAA